MPFCPEVAGGFSVPRTPAEIQRGDGHDVLRYAARVVDRNGHDVTEGFLSGAHATVRTASRHGVKLAILKDGSPSCGSANLRWRVRGFHARWPKGHSCRSDSCGRARLR